MIEVSDSFKQAMNARIKAVTASIVLDDGTAITGDDSLIKIAVERYGAPFGATISSVSAELFGTAYDLAGRNFELITKVLVDSEKDVWESASLGLFYVEESTANLEKRTTIVKGYDVIGRMAKTQYNAGELSFPCTVGALAGQIAARFGLELGDDTQNLPNSNHQIPEDLYVKISNITYRDILAEISGATATMAMAKNGRLIFKRLNKDTIDQNWTYDNLRSIKFKPKYGPISSVVLARTPQEDNVALTDDAVVNAPATKNLISFEDVLFNGIKTTVNNDGSLNCVGTTTASYFNLTRWQKTLPKRLPAGKYTFSRINHLNERLSISLWNADKTKTKQIILEPNIWQLTSELDFEASYYSLAYHGLYLKRAINFQNVKIQLESGDKATAYEPFKENGVTEVKLANNEILDDDRESAISQILEAVKGFGFTPFEAQTEGHGYYECGDRIHVTDGENDWEVIITNIKLEFSQGLKETLSGAAPEKTQTDYARAGGILKTIYNTELKVDKQNQEIQSVVSKATELGSKIDENFTKITQNLGSITNTIQTTGGANLLYNSVGYATDTNQSPTVWVKTGTVKANTSAESLTCGAKSGNQIILSPSASISQTVTITPKQALSLSFRVKKGLIGRATIEISTSENDRRTVTLLDQKEYIWEELTITDFKPELTDLTIKLETEANTTISVTDLMLNVGDRTTPWQQANGEIMNANVLIDKDGVTIKNSIYAGDYMKFTPIEIANYSNASGAERKTFYLNRDITNVQKLKAIDQIEMPPIRIVPISSGNRAGWSFVASKGDN